MIAYNVFVHVHIGTRIMEGTEKVPLYIAPINQPVGAQYFAPAQSDANLSDTMGDKSLFDDDESTQTVEGTRYAMKIL